MDKFYQGERVKHPSKPDWGVGQILDDSDKTVRVFFVGIGEKNLSLDFVKLIKLTGEEAENKILDNLKTVKKSRSTKYQSLSSLIEIFLRVFPDGFFGLEYFERERNYKIAAQELMQRLLDKNNLQKLLTDENYREICKRAMQVVNKTNLISPFEIMSLKDGITANEKLFSVSLFNLLYGENELKERFESFSDCLLELNAAKWTTATYHLFFAFPENQMFLKPTVTQAAAEVCGFELNYKSELNWLTYSKLLDFSRYLLDELHELKPRDMIDVQSFIWCAARIGEGNY